MKMHIRWLMLVGILLVESVRGVEQEVQASQTQELMMGQVLQKNGGDEHPVVDKVVNAQAAASEVGIQPSPVKCDVLIGNDQQPCPVTVEHKHFPLKLKEHVFCDLPLAPCIRTHYKGDGVWENGEIFYELSKEGMDVLIQTFVESSGRVERNYRKCVERSKDRSKRLKVLSREKQGLVKDKKKAERALQQKTDERSRMIIERAMSKRAFRQSRERMLKKQVMLIAQNEQEISAQEMRYVAARQQNDDTWRDIMAALNGVCRSQKEEIEQLKAECARYKAAAHRQDVGDGWLTIQSFQ